MNAPPSSTAEVYMYPIKKDAGWTQHGGGVVLPFTGKERFNGGLHMLIDNAQSALDKSASDWEDDLPQGGPGE